MINPKKTALDAANTIMVDIARRPKALTMI